MDLPTVVGQQTLYYTEVSFSFTYFLSFPLLKSYRKLLNNIGLFFLLRTYSELLWTLACSFCSLSDICYTTTITISQYIFWNFLSFFLRGIIGLRAAAIPRSSNPVLLAGLRRQIGTRRRREPLFRNSPFRSDERKGSDMLAFGRQELPPSFPPAPEPWFGSIGR